MLLLLWTLSVVHAQENDAYYFGLRIEHQPIPETVSGLNGTIDKWLPWMIYSNPKWTFKGTVLPNLSSQQSKTSETIDNLLISQTLLSLEGERTISSDILHWNIGLGLQSNIPLIKQQSTQYTELEQEDVDTQIQNQEAEIAYTRIRIPCTVQVPIQKHLQFGLGFQTSYTIQRSQSDFTTYFNTSWYTSPIIFVQIR